MVPQCETQRQSPSYNDMLIPSAAGAPFLRHYCEDGVARIGTMHTTLQLEQPHRQEQEAVTTTQPYRGQSLTFTTLKGFGGLERATHARAI